jgi:hypothetical protein
MFISIIYIIIFTVSVCYLIRYRLNIKKAAEMTNEALFPRHENEFASIIIPEQWKEMGPLTKKSKSYQFVHWGTFASLVLLIIVLGLILLTNKLSPDILNLAFIFYLIINAVRHKGNLFILPRGIILNGKFYSTSQISSYTSEQIVRWHDLYGLDSKINHAYKLTMHVKTFRQPDFVVVKDRTNLEKITLLLDQQGILGTIKNQPPNTLVRNIK